MRRSRDRMSLACMWVSLFAVTAAMGLFGCKKKSEKATTERGAAATVEKKAEKTQKTEETQKTQKTEKTEEAAAKPEIEAEDIEEELEDVELEMQDVREALRKYGAKEREEALSAMEKVMGDLDEAMESLEKRLDLLHKRLNAEAYLEFKETLWAMRVLRYELAEWYGGMKYGTDVAWEEIKEGFSKAYEDLSTSFQEAAEDLGDLEVEYRKPVKIDMPPPKSTGPKTVRD